MTDFPQYCFACGAAVDRHPVDGRERAYCPACEEPRYRNPKPCAGVLVVDGEQVLLVKRSTPPAVGSWSVPAGYLEHDEPAAVAAARELWEETAVEVSPGALDLLDTVFVDHADDGSVLVVVYAVGRADATGAPTAGSDAADAQFWSPADVVAGPEPLEPGYREVLERAVRQGE